MGPISESSNFLLFLLGVFTLDKPSQFSQLVRIFLSASQGLAGLHHLMFVNMKTK